MSQHTGHESDRDRRFAERLSEHFCPAPLGAAERARFDARLSERIERSRDRFAALPMLLAFGGAAAAVTLGWWLWSAALPPSAAAPESNLASSGEPVDGPFAPRVEDSFAAADWETDVLLADSDATQEDGDTYLPDEYVVLAAFIDGP